jgi:hypothetical protein
LVRLLRFSGLPELSTTKATRAAAVMLSSLSCLTQQGYKRNYGYQLQLTLPSIHDTYDLQ